MTHLDGSARLSIVRRSRRGGDRNQAAHDAAASENQAAHDASSFAGA